MEKMDEMIQIYNRTEQICFPIREKSNDSNENTLNRLRRIRHGRDHQYEYRYRDSAWR